MANARGGLRCFPTCTPTARRPDAEWRLRAVGLSERTRGSHVTTQVSTHCSELLPLAATNVAALQPTFHVVPERGPGKVDSSRSVSCLCLGKRALAPAPGGWRRRWCQLL